MYCQVSFVPAESELWDNDVCQTQAYLSQVSSKTPCPGEGWQQQRRRTIERDF